MWLSDQMSSSSEDEYHAYRRSFPVHDAVDAGDMDTLARLLAPPRDALGTPAGDGLVAGAAGGLEQQEQVRLYTRTHGNSVHVFV